MKVLWFVNTCPGAVARALGEATWYSGGWLEGLASALGMFARDVSLSVAFSGKEERKEDLGGVSYYSLPPARGGAFVQAVMDCLDDAKPDVIHVHGTESIAQKLPDCVFAAVPTVVSIQGVIEECGKWYLGGLTKGQLKPFRSPLRALLGKTAPWDTAKEWQGAKAVREKRICEMADLIVGRTDFDRAWVGKTVAGAGKYRHVDEIMRPEFYTGPCSRNETVKRSIYASAAFSYPLKGGHFLLSAAAKVKERYPDIRVSVAASAGLSDRSLRALLARNEYSRYLLDLIRRLGLEENIRFLGTLGASEVRAELERCELFVLPSTMENSPNALLEAQLVGVPAVSTAAGGAVTIARNSAATRLVPVANPDAMAGAIIESFQDCGKLQSIARAEAAAIAEKHAPERVALRMCEVYRECAAIRNR